MQLLVSFGNSVVGRCIYVHIKQCSSRRRSSLTVHATAVWLYILELTCNESGVNKYKTILTINTSWSNVTALTELVSRGHCKWGGSAELA